MTTTALIGSASLKFDRTAARHADQSARARLDLMLEGPRNADVAAAEAALAAAQARLNQLLHPSAGDVSAQSAAVTAAETALANGRVAVQNSRNSLVASVTLYCNISNAVIVGCNTALPIPQEDLDTLQQLLRTNIYWASSSAGPAAITMVTANAAYLTALNNIPNLEHGLATAQDRYGLLLHPSASDIAAQRSQVATAQANLDNRRLPYTDADIAGQRAAVAAAQAGVAAARTSLEQTSIVAPFDGLVAQRLLDVGATVSPQTPVFVLVAKAVEIHVTVDEARVGQIRPGMTAEVSVPAYPDRTFTATVATVAPLGDARAHTFDVTLIAEDPAQQLQPGMFAEVQIVVATRPDAILVPTAAVVQQGGSARLFVVTDGEARATPVQVGLADADNTEIAQGIAAGAQVVIVGQNVLRDGQAVQIATGPLPSAPPPAPPDGGEAASPEPTAAATSGTLAAP